MSEPVVRHMGELKITRISEPDILALTPARLFPDLADEAADPALFPPHMLTEEGFVRLAVHAWLVEGPLVTLLVDTGIGNAKARPKAPLFHERQTDFLDTLAAAGVAPSAVDLVLLSHLHVDHVGWNTVRTDDVWLPTFPHAKYVFSEKEYRFYAAPQHYEARHHNSFLARMDSVDPVVANGQAVMIAVDGSEVMPNVRFHATPGHSPDHAVITIDTPDGRLLFAADTLHHPAQVLRPDVNSTFDLEPEAARASRRKMLDMAAEENTLLFGAHLSGTSVLDIRRTAEGYTWREA
ncbi:MBL fold metallo-hydrolase [Acuticoccus mangrovi]|uniref:MBL fold metallo-hydrolase n=1 Tax=Acuticoccus mangrovi TaxID=2796142 RepID=A0A934MHJ7_9HYPH|nr:MBL fold metallo-hydrolase [Acuticoccus mangrovi]MBJ3777010.1 MBL fold metallo-hydrolase [Acuticoccus mangrovi]